ncbi:Aste57867_11749 [Aphanomyces stellatus]|uniref:Aste57867_11749 protein n=1 Tax=Aphanomyces stellatus TaxID=120398 RepID=A0A485KVR8_9STRA|nr:hypothetical protein As57867_011704 [Aphanomyces stellatus]VFT88605.1 Aste57867_11749 [Aphanomyces stellatus]
MWRSPLKTRQRIATLSRGSFPQQLTRSMASTVDAPDSSDAVIIGGGVVGTSIAYHLAKYGAKNVVLLEKTELTAGSTWHAAGLVTYFNPGINLKKFHNHSLNLYKTLEAETGQSVGLHAPGSIRICTTPARMDEAKYQQSRQNWHEAFQALITPDEIAAKHPLLNMDGILGGVYTTGDGHIDPYSVTMALAQGARQHGAHICQHTPALGLEEKPDGTWLVTSSKGTIHAKTIVNCTGFWGRELLQSVGVDLPLVSIEHQYVITNSIPEVVKLPTELPVIRDLEASYYLRQERTGMLVGPYEAGEHMKVRLDWQATGVPPDFGKELFAPDVDRILPHLEAAMARMPVLEDAGIQNVTCGPICYAPDAMPLVGPLPHRRLRNVFIANGMSYGIAHGGGCGDYVARWILDGEPPYDLSEIDPARYGKWTTPAFTATKARESYGDNNLITHPILDKKAARPSSRVTPLYKTLKEAGAQFGFHSGWEVPHWFAKNDREIGHQPSFFRTNSFEPVKRECRAVMEAVGITDLSSFATYEISGVQAREFLEHVCANAIPKTSQIRIAHLCTPKGKVMGELTITPIDDNTFYVVTGAGSELHDLRWLDAHADAFPSVTMTNTSDETAVIGLAGPNAASVLEAVTGGSPCPFMKYEPTRIKGIDVRVLGLSFTGEAGYELHFPLKDVAEVYNALWEAGQRHGIENVGSFAVNSMRLEKGFRVWGFEMNKDTTPLQAGLHRFVKLNKATPFIGQTALQTEAEQGSTKSLVMLHLHTDKPAPGHQPLDAWGNEAVWHNGSVVGNTTSGGYGYAVQKSISFAYVPPSLANEGQRVQVELVGHQYDATVHLEPFMDTQPTRVKKAKKAAIAATA